MSKEKWSPSFDSCATLTGVDMRAQDMKKLEELFHAALELRGDERERFVAESCRDRPDLREELEKLLAAADAPRAAVDTPVIKPVQRASEPLPAPIGPYRILEVLGEGGMGTVYLAQQTLPVKRRVALKLIKLGMDTKQVVARFETERQALALMNHPNVAAVYDGGATEQGRPYFVMEFVPGEPITAYCDKHQLSLPQRLDLFMQVCRAIQHAHQKGIIHRDIKPSNVLVMDQDGKPVPKVIDFGVAKATDQRLTEKTIFTEQGLLIGTPAYMSPEQADMTSLDIDTRTDVYSLGVLLYELLTGTLPFDPKSLRSAGFAAIQRIIREVEPSKPSTKFSDLLASDDESGSHVAEKRRLDPRTLMRRLRGDLDWVTMKALEKDRTRRYDSASDLAADIQRHLSDEPVIAGPPSVAYRAAKFVRRNRAGVIAAALVAIVLIAGVAATTWQATIATHQRNRAVHAEQEQSRARQEAQEATRDAQWESYVANINAADMAVKKGDIASAKRRLAQAPEHLRNWEWSYLHAQTDQSAVTWDIEGKTQSFAISPGGMRLASVSEDRNTIKIWDVATKEDLATLRNGEDQVRFVTFSGDGARLASVHEDNVIKIWNTGEGEELAVLQGHEERVRFVTFSPDSKRLAANLANNTVRIWDTSTAQELATVPGYAYYVRFIAFSPDGQRIASQSKEGDIKIWDISKGEELATLPAMERAFFAFSSDGAHIVSPLSADWSNDGIQLWDATTYEPLSAITNTHAVGVTYAAFSPDGTRVASCSSGNSPSGPSMVYSEAIKIWDSETGEQLATLTGNEKGVSSFSFSPDGTLLASHSNPIRLWDTATGERLATLRGHVGAVSAVVFSPDGARLISSGARSTKVWEVALGLQGPFLRGHEGGVNSVAFSPDGTRLASGSDDHTVRIWDAVTGEELAILRGHEHGVFGVAFSPDGTRLASCSRDHTIKLWDALIGAEIATLRGDDKWVTGIAFSPNGTRLASCSRANIFRPPDRGNNIKLWDAVTGEEISTVFGPGRSALSIAFSPDGTRIASGLVNGGMRILDPTTGEDLVTLIGHKHWVAAVSFSPDGTRLASSSSGSVKLWDVSTGEQIATLLGHGSTAYSVAFSADGTRLITGSGDHTITLWDLVSGEELITLTGHGHAVTAVAVSTDGTRIASASNDYTIRIWDSVPSAQRYRERAATVNARSAVKPLVDRLFAALGDVHGVIEAVQNDSSLSDFEHRAARNLILRRNMQELSRQWPRIHLKRLRQRVESPEGTLMDLQWYARELRNQGLELSRGYWRLFLVVLGRNAESPDATVRDFRMYARVLLTIDPLDLRHPAVALPFALRACELSDYKNPAILDTLALAQHLTGDTPAAIETEKKALSLLPPDAPKRDEYEAALAKFEAALAEADIAQEPGGG